MTHIQSLDHNGQKQLEELLSLHEFQKLSTRAYKLRWSDWSAVTAAVVSAPTLRALSAKSKH